MPFPFLSTRSRFARALEAYGLGNCSLSPKSQALLVGMKPRPGYPMLPISAVPAAPKSISFFEAPIQAALIAALMRSPEAKTLEQLSIGTSHDWANKDTPDLAADDVYNMTAAVAALAGARLPALKQLTLGDMEMLYNGQRLTGTIGDVTPLFDAAPNLDELSLSGTYVFSRPVRHDRLRSLTAEQSDIGCWADPPSQESITQLFSSHLPHLTNLSIHVDSWEDVAFDLPDAFFTGGGFPALKQLDFNKLTPAAEARLADWKTSRGITPTPMQGALP